MPLTIAQAQPAFGPGAVQAVLAYRCSAASSNLQVQPVPSWACCEGFQIGKAPLVMIMQVRLASVRRSLFTGEEERSKFLNELVTGTTQIMSSQQGLSLHSNYHEFCRLLGRLKTNYQLAELVRGCLMPLP